MQMSRRKQAHRPRTRGRIIRLLYPRRIWGDKRQISEKRKQATPVMPRASCSALAPAPFPSLATTCPAHTQKHKCYGAIEITQCGVVCSATYEPVVPVLIRLSLAQPNSTVVLDCLLKKTSDDWMVGRDVTLSCAYQIRRVLVVATLALALALALSDSDEHLAGDHAVSSLLSNNSGSLVEGVFV